METQAAKDFKRKIDDLESAQVRLKEEISKFLLASEVNDAAKKRYGSFSTSREGISPSFQQHSSPSTLGGEFQLNSGFYLNVLQSMGQAVHVMNTDHRLIYWNRTAENLYGYNAAEALGKSVFELLVDPEHFDMGVKIAKPVQLGECWTGFFPVNSKKGRRFTIVLSNMPLYDEDGTVIGITCSAADSKSFEDMRFTLPYAWNSGSNVNFNQARTSVSAKLGLDPDQPVQGAIASKITDLANKVANKVKSKMKYGKNNVVFEVSINDNLRSNVASLRGHAASFFGRISKTGELASKNIEDLGEESEGRAKITSKAEAWISKKSINWPWKGNQQELSEAKSESKTNRSS